MQIVDQLSETYHQIGERLEAGRLRRFQKYNAKELSALEKGFPNAASHYFSEDSLGELRAITKGEYILAPDGDDEIDVQVTSTKKEETYTITYTPLLSSEEGGPSKPAGMPTVIRLVAEKKAKEVKEIQWTLSDESTVTFSHTDTGWESDWAIPENKTTLAVTMTKAQDACNEILDTEKVLYLALKPVIRDQEADAIMKQLVEFGQEREAHVDDRFPKFYSRRQFLRHAAIASTMAFLLTSCGPVGANAVDEMNKSSTEWKEFQESGAPLDIMLEEVDADSQMSSGAKQYLWGTILAKAADGTLLDAWQKTVIPPELIEAGLYPQGDLRQIYQFKIANGGYRGCDVASNLRFKVSIDGTADAVRLSEAYNYFRTSWAKIGVPQQYIDQIRLVQGGMIDGQKALILVTPNMGNTLDTFVKTLRASGTPNADAYLVTLMENYYKTVLAPMNFRGIIQPDLNYSNIIMSISKDGPQLIPIDLAVKPHLFAEGMIFEWQYNELRQRSINGNRNIPLPTWEDFLVKYPDFADQIKGFEYISTKKPFSLEMIISGRKVRLLIPEDLIAPSYTELTSEARSTRITEVLTSVEQQLSADEKFLRTPQGSIMRVDVPLSDGTSVPVAITKATAFGEKIETFGGRWANSLAAGKAIAKSSADFLMVVWVAAEAAKYTDPAYFVPLSSNIAFPDSVVPIGKMEASYLLDNIFDRLVGIRVDWAQRAAGNLVTWNPSWETMLGMSQLDAIQVVSKYGISQYDLSQEFQRRARETVFPIAQCIDQFQSPVPIFLGGAEFPMTAWFSAFIDFSTNKEMMTLWAQAQGDAEKIIPIAVFSRDSGGEKWDIETLAETGWNISVFLSEGNNPYILTCEPDSDGKTFVLSCVKQ